MSKDLNGAWLQLWDLRMLDAKAFLENNFIPLFPAYLEIFLFQIFFPCLPPFGVDLARSFEMPMTLNTYPLNV